MRLCDQHISESCSFLDYIIAILSFLMHSASAICFRGRVISAFVAHLLYRIIVKARQKLESS